MSISGLGRIFSEQAKEKLRVDALSRIDKIKISLALVNNHPVLSTNQETGEIVEYCSINEAARVLGVNEKTIRNYINSKKVFKGKYTLVKKENI